MSNQDAVLSLVLGIPFTTVIICWISLLVAMRNTTGELKLWLAPDNVVKGLTIIFITSATLALAVTGIIGSDLVGALFSGIVGYTLGADFRPKANI